MTPIAIRGAGATLLSLAAAPLWLPADLHVRARAAARVHAAAIPAPAVPPQRAGVERGGFRPRGARAARRKVAAQAARGAAAARAELVLAPDQIFVLLRHDTRMVNPEWPKSSPRPGADPVAAAACSGAAASSPLFIKRFKPEAGPQISSRAFRSSGHRLVRGWRGGAVGLLERGGLLRATDRAPSWRTEDLFRCDAIWPNDGVDAPLGFSPPIFGDGIERGDGRSLA